MLLVFVAAPLRRSGAYTLPDFAQLRVESDGARRVASALVVLIGVLYLVPQLQGAGLTLRTLTGAPAWVGAVTVALVVLLIVASGGMRRITLVQAFQYWLKLVALLFPVTFLLLRWRGGTDRAAGRLDVAAWVEPLTGEHAVYLTYSLILATFLGTMGLPHVVVRFYTNRDGRAARRTTVAVLGLLSCFYLLPPVYGVLGRVYAYDLVAKGRADSVVLELPHRILGGPLGDALTALLAAGAFAAFLSTSSGLVVSIGGVLSQDLLSRRFDGVTAFRLGSTVGALVTLALTLVSTGLAVAHAVELAFAVAASTFCPLLLLGIWWRGLTAVGAVVGLCVGGGLSAAAVGAAMAGVRPGGWADAVLAQPALVTVPVAFAAMVDGLAADPQPAPRAPLAHDGAAAHPRAHRARPRQLPPRGARAALTVRRARATARRGTRHARLTTRVTWFTLPPGGSYRVHRPGSHAPRRPCTPHKEQLMATTETPSTSPQATGFTPGAHIADPAPLGLAAFALTTFVLSVINAGWINSGVEPVVFGLALAYGGLGQLLAGMWEFAKGNTFGATAFSSYGAFWISFWWLTGHTDLSGAGDSAANGVGLYLLAWGIFTAYMTVAASRVSGAVLTVFALLTATFLVLAWGEFASSTAIHNIGGYLGLATAAAAWYTSFAGVTAFAFKRPVLPTGAR